jgi:hypothetical protein
MTATLSLLPGTLVSARGLRWEIVTSQNLGPRRGTENAVLGQKLDILCPLEAVEPVRRWHQHRRSIFYYFAISGRDSAAGSTSAVENAQVERRELRPLCHRRQRWERRPFLPATMRSFVSSAAHDPSSKP